MTARADIARAGATAPGLPVSLTLAWAIARRELRGGLAGFYILLACLALGVAAIAGVGMVRSAITEGLRVQGATLLGGDAQVELTYRFADAEERAFLAGLALQTSEIVDFRSMIVTGPPGGEERALTQIKAVDDAYPLIGAVVLEGEMTLPGALAMEDGLPGSVMDKVLADRLELAPGDRFRLGATEFRLGGVLLREPDSATGGFALGPRTIVRTADLAQSGLIAPGTLFDTALRLRLPPGADLDALKAQVATAFPDGGLRWSDSRRAAPGIDRFVTRIGTFLILVGIAGLAVGGVGVYSAVHAYLAGKTATIATLKTLGAESGLIFAAYLMQVGVLAALGVTLGLILGAGVPLGLAPWLTAALPFPAEFALYPRPLVEAGFYGLMTALLFALWPLAQAEGVRAAALYRGAGAAGWPRARYLLAMGGLAAGLVGGAVAFSGAPSLTLGAAGAILAALLVLALVAWGLRRLARALARSPLAQGRPGLRLALAAIGAERGEAGPVILAIGLGLTVLAATGQIDANLRSAIARDLPTRAPSYFFLDIQNDQIAGFLNRVTTDPQVSKVESAPMLRGVLTQINDRPAREVAGNHWVLNGDRGVTYSATPPDNATITAGEWWPADYAGPPLASFSAEEAEEMGLALGDRITVNILGRDITAQITSLRTVDFSTAGMGFILSLSPGALAGAPHTHIATVYADPQAEAAILRDVGRAFPNVTAIRVRDAIDRVTEALGAIATATAWAATATLITGFVVLIGAAAAGEASRMYEAAILKVLGASRARILASFALRAGLMGAAAGLVAIGAGALAGWAVMTFVMEARYAFEPVSAIGIVVGGVLATLIAGLAFAWRPISVRPAARLRAAE